MANTTKKTVHKKPRATQAKSGAGPAIGAHSKDAAKKSFGKAPPKRADTHKSAGASKPKVSSGSSVAARMGQAVKDAANVVVGAAVSIVSRGKAGGR